MSIFYPELQENNITLMKEDVLIQLNDYFKKPKKKVLKQGLQKHLEGFLS